MGEHTRECPGCYHSLIKYLASKENTDTHKLLKFNNQSDLVTQTKSMKKPYRLKYSSYSIQVIDKEGVSHPYVLNQIRYDNPKRAIIPDHFLIKAMKSMSDFATVVKGAGSYTDSLGNGWSQKVSMYQVDDHFFAEMDCACR